MCVCIVVVFCEMLMCFCPSGPPYINDENTFEIWTDDIRHSETQ